MRQDAHAFMWLWGLLLALAGAALVVRRHGRPFEAAILLFLAGCTSALGFIVFYACYAYAPYSMGLSASSVTAARLTTFSCLSQEALPSAFLWTIVALSCSAALGFIAWGRSHDNTAAFRAITYIGAALLLLLAAAAGFVWFFEFSWCSSRRLFQVVTPGYNVVLLAIDHLQMVVAQELSSRYCPHSKPVFLARFWVLFAAFVAAALALFFAANRAKRPSGRTLPYVVAGVLLLFAMGGGWLVLYGLSGCSGVAAEGLIWDWPQQIEDLARGFTLAPNEPLVLVATS